MKVESENMIESEYTFNPALAKFESYCLRINMNDSLLSFLDIVIKITKVLYNLHISLQNRFCSKCNAHQSTPKKEVIQNKYDMEESDVNFLITANITI